MGSQSVSVGSVVISDLDRVFGHADITFKAEEEVLSHVVCVPVRDRFSETLAKLMYGRLGDQSHTHLCITNVEIHRPRPVPTKRLVRIEELFDVPAFRKVAGQGIDLVAIRGG